MSTWPVACSSVTHLYMPRHCRYSLINLAITLITHLKPSLAGNLEDIIIFFPRGGVRVGVCVDAQEAVADVRELEIYQWIVYIQSMTLFWQFFKAHLWPNVIDQSQWHTAISLMSITKLSLTSQWQFFNELSKNSHWPVNDTFSAIPHP